MATASDVRLADRPAYPLDRCADCGTATIPLPERPRDPHSLYDAGTYARPPHVVDLALEPLRRLFVRERLRALGPIPPRSRVLEIGAGQGRLVAALVRRGYDATGIEPYVSSTAPATRNGPRVVATRIEDAEIGPGTVNAVVLWHVLEHLQDPEQVLTSGRRWLADGGAIVIAVPNLTSLQSQLGGDRWFHQDVPRHVVHFTERGLRLLLQRCGFQIEQVSHVVIEQNLFGMWQTILNRITTEPNVFFSLVKRNLQHQNRRAAVRDAILTALLGIPLVPAALVLELGAGFAGRGGTLVARGIAR